ncbi:transcriptional regulator family: Centromere protein B DNA-binding region [Penicillium angulare]|uniref:transcriptional regulator family: Centromere protein B DNA-binding region n=1 Tax=Penicillium angulare TaxID=116970 RepID=UPI002541781C|nr:transcriptional regulator family: Centromere protein B DNA-binding region [Penicillium angulare]XP_056777906.1 transcriptional regulator family: Centromere protein B DNA-binding region [Penicillium angulare]KAJ5267694.1 transcriptional regulator family: Centromere protein B DNA-binding region [Penicillium angulare]KAJ5273841.1 transcriptional regulator family: Centromere protein B DNA-binding region [Penicillium angulare]
MADFYENKEYCMEEAIGYISTLEKPNLSRIAEEYGISPKVLWTRVRKNSTPRNQRKPTNKALNDTQEAALMYWIKSLDDAFIPPTPNIIEQWANMSLARSATPDRTVGKNWVYRFMKRFSKDDNDSEDSFGLRRQKVTDSKRISDKDVAILRHWYDLLANIMNGVPERLVYNFDETGFQLGQGQTQKVFTRYQSKIPRLAGEEHGERVTVAECIAADGWRMEPLIIFKGRHQMESWYNTNLPQNWMTATTEKGYMIDELAVSWLKRFDQETQHRVRRGEYRILLLDGCGSHLTVEFLMYAEQKRIKIFCFPANKTNYIQPLDGKPFLAYKAYFRQQNNLISQWGGGITANKNSFLEDLMGFRDKALTQRVCRNSFRERGIYPVNAEIVCKPLEDALPPIPDISIDLRNTPSPPPENLLSSSLENTPSKTIEDVQKRRQKLAPLMELDGVTPKLKRRFEQVLTEMNFHVEAIQNASTTIAKMAQIQAPRAKKTTKRQLLNLKNDGILRVKDANRSIAERREKEDAAEERRVAREIKKRDAKTPSQGPVRGQNSMVSTEILGANGDVIGYHDTFVM